jgi:hypothetical protein
MEKLKPYYRRFEERFRQDATPWARDNILWGVVVLLAPPVAVYLHDRHAPIEWGLIKTTLWLYGLALGTYALVHLCRVPKKLDDERAKRETELSTDSAALKETIQRRDDTIRAITQKPKRTAAEQHAFDTVKEALRVTKEDGLAALRHLKYQGKLTFGTYAPQLPLGLTLDRTLWVYNQCQSVGVVNRTSNLGYSEYTYSLSSDPAMTKALDDLLFAE